MSAASDPPRPRRDTATECGDEEIESLKRRLAESEERLSLITEATSDGVYEWDIETDDLTVSPKLVAMFGIGPQEITPKLWAARIHPEDFAAYRAAMISHFKGVTNRLSFAYRIRDDKGTERWASENEPRDQNAHGCRAGSRLNYLRPSTYLLAVMRMRRSFGASWKALMKSALASSSWPWARSEKPQL
jgi:PAS domain S-box-containing protein